MGICNCFDSDVEDDDLEKSPILENNEYIEYKNKEKPRKKGKRKISTQQFSTAKLPPRMSIGDIHRVKFIRKIGEGGFSYVYEVVDVETKKKYAVKRLLIQTKEQKLLVDKEIEVMQKLRGQQNIIQLYGFKTEQLSEEREIVWLLMEYAENSVTGLINQRLKDNPTRSSSSSPHFTQREVLQIFHDLCKGVSILHHTLTPPIVHRDLKIENILKIRNVYKLCDFGSCTSKFYQLSTKSERSEAEGDIAKNTTAEYRSPEMVDVFSGFPITTKSDIWSLGCVLYKLLFFEGPFETDVPELRILSGKIEYPPRRFLERKELFESSSKKGGDHLFVEYDLDEMKKLIDMMLNHDVHERPDIFKVLEVVERLLGVDGQEEEEKVDIQENNVEEKPKFDSWDPFGEKN